MKRHLNHIPDRSAYTIDAWAGGMLDDGYHQLIKDSAKRLVCQGHGRATYVSGWGSATLWEYRNPGVTINIVARPYREKNHLSVYEKYDDDSRPRKKEG